MTDPDLAGLYIAESRTPYGRSPAIQILDDVRGLNLAMERQMCFGPIPVGRTVYRVKGGDWRLLP